MNDNDFNELLNLYLDHEISVEDATRLEAEVQKNPARRQRYLQYCRMQKACSMLSEEYVEQAANGDTRNISGFVPEQARWWSSSYAAASLVTMAACVAFIMVMHRPAHQSATVAAVSSGPQSVATAAMEKIAESSTASLHTVSVPMHRSDMQSVIAPYSFRNPQVLPGAQMDPRLNWLQNVQLVSLPVSPQTPLQFEKTAPQPAPQNFGPLQTPTELNALQFQK